MKKIVAIYHKDCNDGTTAGAVVLRKFPEAQVFPLHHSYTKEDIEPILNTIDSETEIYTVDCGLGVKEILDLGYKVTTLDHHIGAKYEFETLAKENPNFTFVFDNEKSGASLTWSYFFPDEESPEFVKLIEDVDLWKWRYGDDSKYVNDYMAIFQNDTKKVLELMTGDINESKEKGKIVALYTKSKIETYIKIEPIKIKIGEHEVLAYNILGYRSEIGNILCGKKSETVALYNIAGDKVIFSFRSKEGQNPSAFDLAQTIGGGGHKLASGATIPLKDFLQMILQ